MLPRPSAHVLKGALKTFNAPKGTLKTSAHPSQRLRAVMSP